MRLACFWWGWNSVAWCFTRSTTYASQNHRLKVISAKDWKLQTDAEYSHLDIGSSLADSWESTSRRRYPLFKRWRVTPTMISRSCKPASRPFVFYRYSFSEGEVSASVRNRRVKSFTYVNITKGRVVIWNLYGPSCTSERCKSSAFQELFNACRIRCWRFWAAKSSRVPGNPAPIFDYDSSRRMRDAFILVFGLVCAPFVLEVGGLCRAGQEFCKTLLEDWEEVFLHR